MTERTKGIALWTLITFATIGMLTIPACALSLGQQGPPAQMRRYIIIVSSGGKDVQQEIAADSITESNGCILFWRGKTLDTVLCDNMSRVMVTERN